ncbi:MAG: hypothetical protein HZB70_02745 [Candidatus Berkelbacteria bacterium]|nr:MAG: hypothetical protein HZB70_02745 [Candidatus Berkelbacteria bacterium]QQG51775.1 MAG: hypothetical protein HY845_00250 [Candidatus Berkelbacteria bacterium]
MAGLAGSVPFVYRAQGMAQGEVPFDSKWLRHAAKQCPNESIFHSLLARHNFERCQYGDARDCLVEAIKRETNPQEKATLESELREVMTLGSGD